MTTITLLICSDFKNFTFCTHFADCAVNVSVEVPEDGCLRDKTYSNSGLIKWCK